MANGLPVKKSQIVNRLAFGILNSVVERCLDETPRPSDGG
jgi:hypothetical protein